MLIRMKNMLFYVFQLNIELFRSVRQTYINVMVSKSDIHTLRYRTRNGQVLKNTLAVCD